ncbi:PKD domain-containing protein [Longispora urticae]
MRRTLSLGTVVAALVAGVGVTASPASAALADLYVNNTVNTCSDTGPGSQAQPLCTLAAAAAAVVPGQTVQTTGTYNERLKIAKSGSPSGPITFRNASPDPEKYTALLGDHAGITIDGQHDVSVVGFRITMLLGPDPVVAVNNAARITVDRLLIPGVTADPVPGVKLTGVTNSTLRGVQTFRDLTPAISLDAATSGVQVTSAYLSTPGPKHTDGIEVHGPNNSVVRSGVTGAAGTGILVGATAKGTVVAGNLVGTGRGVGIHNAGATGTTITNNTAYNNCSTGIRVSGASTGVSVQNNVVYGNGEPTTPACDAAITEKVGLGVYGAAVDGTTVDYNTVRASPNNPPYAWKTPVASLTAFRAASGQGAHDLDSAGPDVNIDSGNAAAPGRLPVDYHGNGPEDDPGVPNTGAGPVSYVDRGARERVLGPSVLFVLSGRTGGAVVADASDSEAGWVPISTYTFDFGDGTVVTQAEAVAGHTYTQAGPFLVTVTVTDTNGLTSTLNKSYTPGDGYVPVGPVRVLDTREAIGTAGRTPLAPGGILTLELANRNGVPAGITSVTMNVTVTSPTGPGFLSVYPHAGPTPTSSNLNWVAGQTVPNLVVASVNAGKVDIRNSSGGTVHVVADLVGYHTTGVGSSFAPLGPVRALDTRDAAGRTPVASGGTLVLPVAGLRGVPATGVTAVTMNVTVTEPTRDGFLTVYPDGKARPNASNLNWTPGLTVPNLVVVPVVNGKVAFHNTSPGTVHVIADIVGYHSSGVGAVFRPRGPYRMLDTRSGTGTWPSGAGPVAPGGWIDLNLSSLTYEGATAAILNVTVTEPTRDGFLTVYGDFGQPRPNASNLNWRAGQTVPNLVVVQLNPVNGTARFHNTGAGTVHVVADLVGFYGN